LPGLLRRQVDVRVHLEERPPRGVAIRGGLKLQSGRQEALVGTELSHVNALKRLWRVVFDAEVGAAVVGSELSQIGSLRQLRTGPVADVALDLVVPNLPFRNVETRFELGYEHTITEAFQTDRPSVSALATLRPAPTLTLSGGYKLDFVVYRDLQIDPAELASFGAAPDVVDGRYRNAELQSRMVWDTRNDPFAPTRGQVVDLTLELAGTWLGGTSNYGGGQLELRGYRGLGIGADRPRRALGLRRNVLVFAGRVGGGLLAPYGPANSAVVPVAERLYLGGTGSVRGWTFQHLGPYVCAVEESPCVSEANRQVGDGVDTVPIGGRVSTWASVEVRRTFEAVRLVGFIDAGMVWPTLADVVTRRPLLSTGVGLRLLTPIGPVRADVAFRTDNPAEFRHLPRFWVHLGLGEAF
ncbi:MAG: BamA/TamA family outer membrane protein, partial [Myxococcota bacterium]